MRLEHDIRGAHLSSLLLSCHAICWISYCIHVPRWMQLLQLLVGKNKDNQLVPLQVWRLSSMGTDHMVAYSGLLLTSKPFCLFVPRLSQQVPNTSVLLVYNVF